MKRGTLVAILALALVGAAWAAGTDQPRRHATDHCRAERQPRAGDHGLARTRLWSTSSRLDSLRDVHPGDQLIALGQPPELGRWITGLVTVTGPEVPARRDPL